MTSSSSGMDSSLSVGNAVLENITVPVGDRLRVEPKGTVLSTFLADR